MRILRSAILAIGILGLLGACGGSKKDTNEASKKANPCDPGNPCDPANPCDPSNPCEGGDEGVTGGNPCGGW